MLPRVGERLPYVGGGHALYALSGQIISLKQPLMDKRYAFDVPEVLPYKAPVCRRSATSPV